MERVDVAVIGAGLAGLSCAYTLAKAGLDVLVVERGDYPGSKNVTGGRLYMNPVRQYLPEIWDEAPFERLRRMENWRFSRLIVRLRRARGSPSCSTAVPRLLKPFNYPADVFSRLSEDVSKKAC